MGHRLAILLFVFVTIGSRVAYSAEPTNAELLERVRVLEEKLARLEPKPAPPSTAPTDVTSNQVLEDAARRSGPLAPVSFTAGWDAARQQFFLASADRNFYFHPAVLLQFRNVTNFREDAKAGGGDDLQNGFEVRRAKFGFDGNIFGPDLTYRFLWQSSTNGGTPAVESAFAQYTLVHNIGGGPNEFAVRAGQFKDVVSKEEFNSDAAQLMAERSLANALMVVAAGPLIQGVDLMLIGKDAPVHADLLVHDGVASANTDFTDNSGSNLGVATRIDWKIMGDWIDTADFTGKNSGKNDLLDLGAAIDYSDIDNAAGVRGAVDVQYLLHQQFTVYAAIYGDSIDLRNQPGPTNRNDWGGVIQAGYFLTPAWQAVGRYSIVKFDSAFALNNTDTFHEIGVGFNYFLGDRGAAGNHAKVTFDLNYLPEGCPPAPGLDFLSSPGKTQTVARLQFQLLL